MNNGGTPGGGRTIVGFFHGHGQQAAWYLVQDGMLTPYDPEGADLTAIWDINASGQFVGSFRYATDPPTKRHGFLKDPASRTPIQFDFSARTGRAVPARQWARWRSRPLLTASTRAGSSLASPQFVSLGPAHGFVAFPPDAEATTAQD